IPIRPWRREPDRKAIAISISSGLARFSRSARSSILARRPLVAATRREVWTSSWNNTTPVPALEDHIAARIGALQAFEPIDRVERLPLGQSPALQGARIFRTFERIA